jgi:Lon protease-like protein
MKDSIEHSENDLEISQIPQPGDLYPIFAISNAIFFPKTIIPLHVFEPRYKSLINDIQLYGDKKFILTGLMTNDNPITSQPDSLGVIAELLEEKNLPDGRFNIIVQVLERVKIKEYFRTYDLVSNDYAIAEIIRTPEKQIDSSSEQWLQLRHNLYLEFKTHFENMTNQTLQMTEEAIADSFTPEESINTVCNITFLDYSEKQSLLYIDSLFERGYRILDHYRKLNSRL